MPDSANRIDCASCDQPPTFLGQPLPIGRGRRKGPATACPAATPAFAEAERVRAEERARIARQVHDATSQLLAALQLRTGRLRSLGAIAELQPHLDEIDATLGELRREIRAIAMLNLASETEIDDLPAMLGELARRFSRIADIEVTLHPRRDLDYLRIGAAADLYRITQEALANILRHAAATAVEIKLGGDDRALELVIRDNGTGLAGEGEVPDRPGSLGLGLANICARARAWGGDLVVTRLEPGTSVCVRIPT